MVAHNIYYHCEITYAINNCLFQNLCVFPSWNILSKLSNSITLCNKQKISTLQNGLQVGLKLGANTWRILILNRIYVVIYINIVKHALYLFRLKVFKF